MNERKLESKIVAKDYAILPRALNRIFFTISREGAKLALREIAVQLN